MPRVIKKVPQHRRLDPQQRPDQPNPGGFAKRRHSGETVRLAAAQHPHRQRFHLIRRMVAKQQMKDAGLGAGVRKDLVAHDPGPFGERGTVCQVRETENPRCYAKTLQAFHGDLRFIRRCGSQSVIDDQSSH